MKVPRIHSKELRIWHWLDALVVIALITTYFLRKFLTSHSRELVRRLVDQGVVVTDAQSKPIIHDMVDTLWTWHIYIGYGLTVLFVWRVVLYFINKEVLHVECWQNICAARREFTFKNVHSAAVKTGYVVFYVLQLFMIVTGLVLAFADSVEMRKSLEDPIHEAHEFVMWFFLAFVIAHVAGVFIAENTDDPGIVSAMINGKT